MSHFYASIQGGKSEATRQGTKSSGISGHVRGWGLGVRVEMYVNKDGEDEAHIVLTDGSGDHGVRHFIGAFTRADLEVE